MSLEQLDAFLAHAHQLPDLECRLHDHRAPDLAAFLALARGAGFCVDEEDVIAAQQREESRSATRSCRSGPAEARRLRHFIPG